MLLTSVFLKGHVRRSTEVEEEMNASRRSRNKKCNKSFQATAFLLYTKCNGLKKAPLFNHFWDGEHFTNLVTTLDHQISLLIVVLYVVQCNRPEMQFSKGQGMH